MNVRSEIRFSRVKHADGFGFNCMKTAYTLDVKGRLDCYPEGDNQIIAEADENNLNAFIAWIKDNIDDDSQLTCYNSLNYSGVYKEFDIFLHASIPL
ncbi:hypothetical protein SDC9_08660 [bioreactor metagenome]|jgi:acylphosphatase|uniref:Acylphosphatase-like domain-containing protein n=1 Tax=bioreactor metagenome TaxID=1076179 RepID=A0A644T887_9ZZZZ|nr:hypothetical protein [Lentimicrobium sp.]MEA5109259.1 hypothetical protein [Lentimicrobium sp.]